MKSLKNIVFYLSCCFLANILVLTICPETGLKIQRNTLFVKSRSAEIFSALIKDNAALISIANFPFIEPSTLGDSPTIYSYSLPKDEDTACFYCKFC